MSGLTIRYDFLLMAVCRAQGIMMISSMKITGSEPHEPCSHHGHHQPGPGARAPRQLSRAEFKQSLNLISTNFDHLGRGAGKS